MRRSNVTQGLGKRHAEQAAGPATPAAVTDSYIRPKPPRYAKPVVRPVRKVCLGGLGQRRHKKTQVLGLQRHGRAQGTLGLFLSGGPTPPSRTRRGCPPGTCPAPRSVRSTTRRKAGHQAPTRSSGGSGSTPRRSPVTPGRGAAAPIPKDQLQLALDGSVDHGWAVSFIRHEHPRRRRPEHRRDRGVVSLPHRHRGPDPRGETRRGVAAPTVRGPGREHRVDVGRPARGRPLDNDPITDRARHRARPRRPVPPRTATRTGPRHPPRPRSHPALSPCDYHPERSSYPKS